jgi:hypothetical protein
LADEMKQEGATEVQAPESNAGLSATTMALLVVLAFVAAWLYLSYRPDSASGTMTANTTAPEATLDRGKAIASYWEDIKTYLEGVNTIEACLSDTGKCYDLDAEIADGSIESIELPDRGTLYFSADIDADGSASDVDRNGRAWNFTLDMSSSMVDDAIAAWARESGQRVE